MPKLLSLLLCLPLLAAPARAHALSTTTSFSAFVNGAPAGTVRFVLDSVIAGVACRYVAAWQSEDGLASTQCSLDEDIWAGRQSCVENALVTIDGIVENIGGPGCGGFDASDQGTSVFLLMLGERADAGELAGVIQYSAASSIPSAFEAVAAGP